MLLFFLGDYWISFWNLLSQIKQYNVQCWCLCFCCVSCRNWNYYCLSSFPVGFHIICRFNHSSFSDMAFRRLVFGFFCKHKAHSPGESPLDHLTAAWLRFVENRKQYQYYNCSKEIFEPVNIQRDLSEVQCEPPFRIVDKMWHQRQT